MSANRIRLFVKNTTVNFVSQFIDKLLSFVLVIVVARYLGPAEFGKYAFCFAFISLFAILSNMGLDTLMIREVSRDKSNTAVYLGNSILIKTVLSIFMFISIAVSISAMNLPVDKKFSVYLGGLYMIFIAMAEIFISFFVAYEKMEFVGAMILIEKIIAVALSLLAVYFQRGYMDIVAAFLLGGLAKLIFGAYMFLTKISKPRFEINLALWKRLMLTALPIGLTQLFFGIYFKIDSVLLSLFRGDKAVGWYNAAYGLVYSLRFIARPVYAAAFPIISQLYTDSMDKMKRAYKLVFKHLFIISLPLMAYFLILPDQIILFFYKNPYSESIKVLSILAWIIPFIFVSYAFYMAFVALGKQNIMGYIYLFIIIVNVTSNILLIPRYSYIGAAISMIISEVLGFIIIFLYLGPTFCRFDIFDVFIKPIAAGAFLACTLIFLKGINIFLLVPLSFAVYVLCLFLLRVFGDEEKSFLSKLVAQKT